MLVDLSHCCISTIVVPSLFQTTENFRDVLFLIDRSGSITNAHVQKTRDMAAALVHGMLLTFKYTDGRPEHIICYTLILTRDPCMISKMERKS